MEDLSKTYNNVLSSTRNFSYEKEEFTPRDRRKDDQKHFLYTSESMNKIINQQ